MRKDSLRKRYRETTEEEETASNTRPSAPAQPSPRTAAPSTHKNGIHLMSPLKALKSTNKNTITSARQAHNGHRTRSHTPETARRDGTCSKAEPTLLPPKQAVVDKTNRDCARDTVSTPVTISISPRRIRERGTSSQYENTYPSMKSAQPSVD